MPFPGIGTLTSPSSMKLSFVLFAATPFLLSVLTGCLEFKEQTLAFRHDLKNDSLRIFQEYHGIFGAAKPESLSQEEEEQLHSVLTTQRTLLFTNWIFEFNNTAMRKYLL